MYKQIVGPDRENINITHAYIWVLPKSGTIFIATFFHIYSKLLNIQEINQDISITDLLYKERDVNIFNKTIFSINHMEFPGFEDLETVPDKLKTWKNLEYATTMLWNSGDRLPDDVHMPLRSADPEIFSHYKFVFVFRNPLDQLISHYKHFYNYPPDDKDKSSARVEQNSLEDFAFRRNAIASYLKMFYSFHKVRQHFPEDILCVPYEELVSHKPETLRRIMRHLEIQYNEEAFVKALELTSMENLKVLEETRNSSLLVGRQDAGGRHIRNGGIGVWQDHLTPDMVQRIEEQFNTLGLSLTMFHLAPVLEEQFKFLTPMQVTKRMRQK